MLLLFVFPICYSYPVDNLSLGICISLTNIETSFQLIYLSNKKQNYSGKSYYGRISTPLIAISKLKCRNKGTYFLTVFDASQIDQATVQCFPQEDWHKYYAWLLNFY